jgi:ketosteroid isomerase-like protein
MTHHARTTREVFDHHVNALNEANMDEVAFDYAEDAFFITKDDGVIRGREAIKTWFNNVLSGPLVGAKFEATTLIIEGDILYLEWQGAGTTHSASGVDTFLIRDGQIRAQTVKLLSLTPKS